MGKSIAYLLTYMRKGVGRGSRDKKGPANPGWL